MKARNKEFIIPKTKMKNQQSRERGRWVKKRIKGTKFERHYWGKLTPKTNNN